MTLLSPTSGAPLQASGPHLLLDADGRRWPVLDGIPYLRVGRDDLVARALAAIDAADPDGALAILLADQDDWWTGPPADPKAIQTLIARRETLGLCEAMTLLGYGRVGDYFAHRWSDPTFLAGLALLEAHRRPATHALELACGIGHYLREFTRRGIAATGLDVVFSKLWLARHWVVGPQALLVCCDAAAAWPIPAEPSFDLVFCQDAFYFLEPKAAILTELRARVARGGRLAVGHVHNREAHNLSAGAAVSAAEMADFFPNGTFYDDAELTSSLVEARAPQPAPLDSLRMVEAFACEADAAGPPQAVSDGFAMPPAGAALRTNPLYRESETGLAIVWPSDRYEAEYGLAATYPSMLSASPKGKAAIRRRELVDLPERW